MLNDLYLRYSKRQDSDTLLLLIQEACKMLNGMLRHYDLSWQAKEEIVDNCRSKILVKAMQKYVAHRSKFQTYLYWQFLQEIRRVIDYYSRYKRSGSRELVQLDEENTIDLKSVVSNFRDILDFVNSKVSKNSRKFVSLLLEGYNKRQTFGRLNIKSFRLKSRILSEIKRVLREAYVH